MNLSRQFLLVLLGIFVLFSVVRAEDAGDDNVEEEEEEEEDGGNYNYEQADDYIKYWTGYAVLPKKCINYNGVDVIVFSVFENGYKQCSDTPMGTYITPVETFVSAYLDQLEANEYDMGNDDYEEPYSAQYVQCTQYNGNNGQYSVMLGCDDEDSHSLAVNIYSDATCDTRDFENGMDDANIDVSDLQLPFKSCQACVTWLDKDDDEVDDGYYENKMINAPLCSQVWARKEECDKKCQKMGRDYEDIPHWTRPDAILLGLLGVFAAVMMSGVIQKRRSMRQKEDTLLVSESPVKNVESSFSDKQLFIAFTACLLVIVAVAALVIKAATWTLLLGLNLVLFTYLLKLVIESGTACGEIKDEDSDDEDEHEGEPMTPSTAATPAGGHELT